MTSASDLAGRNLMIGTPMYGNHRFTGTLVDAARLRSAAPA